MVAAIDPADAETATAETATAETATAESVKAGSATGQETAITIVVQGSSR